MGYIDREEGVRLVNKYDGKPPKKAIKKYLEYSGFSDDEFWEIVDSFTNKDIFKCDENGKFLRDIDGSLIRKENTILKSFYKFGATLAPNLTKLHNNLNSK